jgi:5'-deoxynucleotidase YfbR-like HD superfamily hydrolase
LGENKAVNEKEYVAASLVHDLEELLFVDNSIDIFQTLRK